MKLFFELEIVYIIIGIFILVITAFVTTRDFVPRVAFKRGMFGVSSLLIFMIGFHYFMTTSRMIGVKKLFNEGVTIICENKMRRTISRSILLSKNLGWSIEGDMFVNKDYERDFHTSRCIEYKTEIRK